MKKRKEFYDEEFHTTAIIEKNFIYRSCPKCGRQIWDRIGSGSGFRIHVASCRAKF